jgi:hypothetical protein
MKAADGANNLGIGSVATSAIFKYKFKFKFTS